MNLGVRSHEKLDLFIFFVTRIVIAILCEINLMSQTTCGATKMSY